MNEILVRLALSSAILLAAAVSWFLLLNLTRLRARRGTSELDGYRLGDATLVYFSSPVCAPCRAVQRPAVERFKQAVGETFRVIEVDASVRPDIAERWGVFSLPTTVFIDSHGNPRTVNPGVTTTETLLAQAKQIRFPINTAS